jgi:hypothetical protein
MNSARRKTGTFDAIVADVERDGTLNVNVLAIGVPIASPAAYRAAGQIFGIVSPGTRRERVARLARLIDELRAADGETRETRAEGGQSPRIRLNR